MLHSQQYKDFATDFKKWQEDHTYNGDQVGIKAVLVMC